MGEELQDKRIDELNTERKLMNKRQAIIKSVIGKSHQGLSEAQWLEYSTGIP